MINENFYIIDHGWAKKYYWLKTINRGSGEDYIKLLKNRKITLGVDRGTTYADVHGSSMALTYFSQKFVDLLKTNNIIFNSYPVNFCDKNNKSIIFYYIEPKTYPINIIEIGKIKNNIDRLINIKSDLLQRTNATGENEFFDFSEYDQTDLFGIENTKYIIITEKLKKIIEKSKIKNVVFYSLVKYQKS